MGRNDTTRYAASPIEERDTGGRKKWRRRIRVIDLSTGRDLFKPEGDIGATGS